MPQPTPYPIPPSQSEPLMKHFEYAHLPPTLRETSMQFHDVAMWLCNNVQRGPERTVSLRKLLESKDAAVRATLHQGG